MWVPSSWDMKDRKQKKCLGNWKLPSKRKKKGERKCVREEEREKNCGSFLTLGLKTCERKSWKRGKFMWKKVVWTWITGRGRRSPESDVLEKFLRGSYGFIELEHRKFLTPLSRGPLKKFENSSEREKGRKKERDVGYEKIFAPTYLELENFEEKTKERWVWNNFWNHVCQNK